jgi:hypothetical protein
LLGAGNRWRQSSRVTDYVYLLIMRLAALTLVLCLCGCSQHEPMELWYWHHSYLVTAEALAKSKLLVDRAASAGYTGAALWDSSLDFLNRPDWDSSYLQQYIAYAHAKGLAVMPAILPYGHSDDILKQNPNWAEGQRVIGVKFRRDGDTLRHMPRPAIPFADGRFMVEPSHQYRVTFFDNATGSVGALDADDPKQLRLVDEAHPGATEFTFNSGSSRKVHVFGPTQFTLEETARVGVVEREGAPLKIYDDSQVFHEGKDFDAALHIPEKSAIREGQQVSADYYAIAPISGEGRGVCLTDNGVQRWAAANAHKVATFLTERSPLFLQHDEMRHMNSCESCKRMHMTPGQLLAWSLHGLIACLPARPLYIWSDMFDPWHNSRPHFYYVEGDLRGSWEGLPASVTVMNWNGARRRASLAWFARRGNAQVIAGYYDPQDHDGARAARKELFEANGIRGVRGLMYTTWGDDYSQLENYAKGAQAQWAEYLSARPW